MKASLPELRIITLPAELESLAAFRKFIEAACEGRPGIDHQFIYDLMLAVDEACTNIITHGYAGMDPGSIMVACQVGGERVAVTITDFGHPFEPYEPERPEVSEDLADLPVEVFGLYFIYQGTDQVDYESGEDGNRLRLVKRIGDR
jgi:anti-sigma regulatory factor (Ser/Thr protein kinase)